MADGDVNPQAYAFAHLTDPHLPLRPGDAPPWMLLGKRITGYLSWTGNRRHIHRPEVLDALIEDIRAQAPDHVAVTGDLANISVAGEFARAGDWLSALGPAAEVTAVPGNHDAYARIAGEKGLDRWAANMRGDGAPDAAVRFPFLRRRGPVAFIGLSTAQPTAPLMAHGTLGEDQIAALDRLLAETAEEGLCRVVMLHHPPAGKGAADWRKGLKDRDAFARVIAERGAELVLHGHIHHWVLSWLAGPGGPVPVLSAASASAADVRGAEPANWNLVRVAGGPGAWRISAETRRLTGDGEFAELRCTDLAPSA